MARADETRPSEDFGEDFGDDFGEDFGDDTAAEPEIGIVDRVRPYISFELAAWAFGYPEEGDPKDPQVQGLLQLRPDLHYRSEHVRLKALANVTLDTSGHTGGVELWVEDGPRRPTLTFEEAFATFVLGGVELSVGKRVFSWSVSDLYSPEARLNAFDLTDPTISRQIGLVSTDAVVELGGDVTLQLVLAPYFTPDRIPERDARWFPVERRLPLGLDVPFPRELPEDAFADPANLQGGVRAKATIGGFDLSLFYVQGFAHVPRPFLQVDRSPRGGLVPSVRLRYARLRAPGFTVSTIWDALELEVHAEGAWNLLDPDMDSSYLSGAIGVNRRWSNLLGSRDAALTLVCELMGELVTREANADRFRLTADDRLYDHTLGAAVIVDFTADLGMRLAGLLRLQKKAEGYFQPSVRLTVWEAVELQVGADLFLGPRDQGALLGRYRDDSRGYAMLRYRF